jgi:transposase
MGKFKYSKDEQLAIGKEIYDGFFTIGQAATKYNVNYYTARDYYRLYRATNNLPYSFKKGRPESGSNVVPKDSIKSNPNYDELKELSNDELIKEVIKARVEAERAKKGYEVKGDGQTKEYSILKKENLK